jgi:adenine/guanine phosphoribosyltransferase-like PRPP-binding protein
MDITTILQDPKVFSNIVDDIAEKIKDVDVIV